MYKQLGFLSPILSVQKLLVVISVKSEAIFFLTFFFSGFVKQI